jgi:hypothetical protein
MTRAQPGALGSRAASAGARQICNAASALLTIALALRIFGNSNSNSARSKGSQMAASRHRQSAALYSSSINANCALLMASMSFTPTHAPAKRVRYVKQTRIVREYKCSDDATCLYVTVRHVTRAEGRLQPFNSWHARHHHIVRHASLTAGNAGSYS